MELLCRKLHILQGWTSLASCFPPNRGEVEIIGWELLEIIYILIETRRLNVEISFPYNFFPLISCFTYYLPFFSNYVGVKFYDA